MNSKLQKFVDGEETWASNLKVLDIVTLDSEGRLISACDSNNKELGFMLDFMLHSEKCTIKRQYYAFVSTDLSRWSYVQAENDQFPIHAENQFELVSLEEGHEYRYFNQADFKLIKIAVAEFMMGFE